LFLCCFDDLITELQYTYVLALTMAEILHPNLKNFTDTFLSQKPIQDTQRTATNH